MTVGEHIDHDVAGTMARREVNATLLAGAILAAMPIAASGDRVQGISNKPEGVVVTGAYTDAPKF